MKEKQLKQILIKVRNGGFITPAIAEIMCLRKEERDEIITKLQKRANKLYCTAEHLGYHDKNCEGACEKDGLKDVIKLLKNYDK